MGFVRDRNFGVVEKDPAVAMALSVVPGVGQFYNGESRKGLLFFLVSVLNCFCLLLWCARVSIFSFCDSLAAVMHVSLNDELKKSLLDVGPNSPLVYAMLFMLVVFTAFAMRDAFTKASFRKLQAIYASSSLAISEATAGSYLMHFSLLFFVMLFVIFFCKPAKVRPQITEIIFVQQQDAPTPKKHIERKVVSQKATEASGKHNPMEKVAPAAKGASAVKPQAPTPKPQAPTPKPQAPTPRPQAPTPQPQAPTPQPQVPTPHPQAPTPHPQAPTPQPQPHPIAPQPAVQPSATAPRPTLSAPPTAPNPVPQPVLKTADSLSKTSNNPVPMPTSPNSNLLAALPPAAAHHQTAFSSGGPAAPGPIRDSSTSSSSGAGNPTPVPSSSHSSSKSAGTPGDSGAPTPQAVGGGHPSKSGGMPSVVPSIKSGEGGAAPSDRGNASPNARPNGPKVTDTDSANPDFGPFMADLQRRIKKAWFPPKAPQSANCQVIFKVQLNGELSGLHVSKSSGIAAYDNAALKAVEGAAPFRPLPAGAKEAVDVQFTFDYNVFSGSGGASRRF